MRLVTRDPNIQTPSAETEMPTRVLLVEDNPDMEGLLREALSGIGGVEVAHAAQTQSAASAWLQQNPAGWDLAVIDIFLREGHGFDVLKCCGQLEPRKPAVLLTNYTREPVRSRAAELGADAVFDKLSELDDFLAFCGRLARGTVQDRCPPVAPRHVQNGKQGVGHE